MGYIAPGTRRIMDTAWSRDQHNNIYTGETLMLMLLLRAKSGLTRASADGRVVSEMLGDPNL